MNSIFKMTKQYILNDILLKQENIYNIHISHLTVLHYSEQHNSSNQIKINSLYLRGETPSILKNTGNSTEPFMHLNKHMQSHLGQLRCVR
jgi:hypothetical protein